MAVSDARVAEIVGYQLKPGTFSQAIPNLPMRIVVLGEANTDNQSEFDDPEEKEFITAKAVGERYGFGSPLHLMARILRPASGQGAGPVPTIFMPQSEPESGATSKKINVEITGPASGNGTHTIVIGDRYGIEGDSYDFLVEDGDTFTEISQKIVDVVNNAIAAPVTATQDTSETTDESALLETKWAGLTANDLEVRIDTGDTDLGVTYSVSEVEAGAGVPEIQDSLDQFEDDWNTIVINPYKDEHFDTLEAFNGRPDPNQPTGRYAEIVMKPFVALFGDRSSDGQQFDFSTRKSEVTNVACPIPNTEYFPFEAAASAATVLGQQAQDEPHLDMSKRRYLDISAPDTIGPYADYNHRDVLAKSGHSTVIRRGGDLEFADFVTTYHPDGENPLQFLHVRNLIVDWNVRFYYYLLEQTHVVGKAIADNGDIVKADNVIKPNDWLQILRGLADLLSERGLIADPDFMKDSISVQISSTNPDRFETRFRYKRTGFARISSTVAEAGFNLGSG